jgi:hypothetical protein
MKKTAIVSFLLLVSFFNSYGQWYVKRYNVSDINFLSGKQLEESLEKSKDDLTTSCCIAGVGGIMMVVFKYIHPGLGEDPTFIEELIGDEGMNKIGFYAGVGLLTGGTIASIVYLGRIGSIRSVINRNFSPPGSLHLSPAIILNTYTRSYRPGFTLTYNF